MECELKLDALSKLDTIDFKLLSDTTESQKMFDASTSYFGYKPSGASIVDEKGTPDNTEFYNISKDDILRLKDTPLEHPAPLLKYRNMLDIFIRNCHKVVTLILLKLSISLGLLEDDLINLHKLDHSSSDQVRITYSQPVIQTEDTQPIIYVGEHTDFGSVTILFNKLGGLQVKPRGTSDWKYVKPEPECAIVNIGDALVKLVGGRLHSGLHRVVKLPGNQALYPRTSVVYFSRPNSKVKLCSLFKEDGISDSEVLTADEWIAKRVYLRSRKNFKGRETFIASLGTEHTKDIY